MTLFLATFLVVYGGMHLYALARVEQAFKLHGRPAVAMRIFLALAILAPLFVRISERAGPDSITLLLAWSSYCWMGFIFILVSTLLTLDILRLVPAMISRMRGDSVSCSNLPRLSCELALVIAVIASIDGYFEARDIRTERITIRSEKLIPSAGRIRIVQLSDVHLGLMVQEDRLKNILRIVEMASPDVLVSTGDLLDGRLSRREETSNYRALAALFAAVRSPYGRFAVTGNHEYYAGLDQSLKITRACGFRVLRNESVKLSNGLIISGSDDPAWKRMNQPPPPGPDESELLRSLPAGSFRVHLKHQPIVEPQNQGFFDLQLSGHTHHGQIFPFYVVTKFLYPFCSGTIPLEKGSIIHVSRGTGVWGPPIRFLAPPEITVIDIVPTKPAQTPFN